jgi:tetratricopeptide (TPR) repeat protein
LLLENFKQGLPEYEGRLLQSSADSDDLHQCGLPLFKDQSLRGKSVLVFDDPALTETIMLSRYLVKLKACGARVVFEVRPELFDLFGNWPLVDQVVLSFKAMDVRSSCHDCIPLASLPERFQTHPDTMPEIVPYVFADPEKAALRSEKISSTELKVGLAWMGSDCATSRRCNPDRFDPLWHIDGIQWYSLQEGPISCENVDLHGRPLIHLGSGLRNLSDMAAVIANLDLVITVDTAVAHLAGAMGKPVWVLLPIVPEWYWFQEQKHTPWYPSMRLYRQSAAGDWDNPLSEMTRDLRQWKSARRHRIPHKTAGERFATAMSLQQRGDFESAEAGYMELLSSVPDHSAALSALGLLYIETQRFTAAAHTLRQALALNPVDHLCLNNLGYAFQRLGQAEAALSLYAGAIACKPDYINAYHNLGNVFLDLNDLDAVVHWYSKALAIDPDNAGAQWQMGKLYLKQLDTANARKHFKRSVALAPQFVPARISLASTALMQGDFSVGWDQYRWRFKDDSVARTTYPARFNLPQWQGEPFQNKRLILHCEQGFGDTIQFARFVPRVKALGGQITFQVQEALLPLFRHFPGVDVLQRLPAKQPEMPDADLYCPLLDVPHWLGISATTIAARTPYLAADQQRTAQWRRRIDPGHFAVGIVWAGNPDHANDHKRSCPLDHLLELGGINGVHLYALQKQISATDNNVLTAQPDTTVLGSDLMDFGDTAAVIACLDLVVSVDTAVAHLAGAMGKPVWLMLPHVPDWRWMLWREDTPWYPTMRLFRQPHENGWTQVMQSIKRDLKAHLNELRIENTD